MNEKANKKNLNLIGAHMSIAGGLFKAFEKGEETQCTAIQIFTKSNRQLFAKPLSTEEIFLFKEKRKQSSVKKVVVHAGYLINIGSFKEQTHTLSTNSLLQELERAEQLGIEQLIFHPGAITGAVNTRDTVKECLKHIGATCNYILNRVPGKSKLLIESSAGAGNSVGSTLEQLAAIVSEVNDQTRIGICIDTCHIFAAGYDIRTKETYELFWQKFETIIGLSKLEVVHVNDSKGSLSSHIDRHELIGRGMLGIDTFRFIVNDPRLFLIPKIIETPVDTYRDYLQEITLLKSLIY